MAFERPGILKQWQKMFVQGPAGNRKPRSVDFAYTSIPLQRGATVNCLLHKHMNGYLLIALNKRNEPVRAWRDCDGFFPIRSRKTDTGHIADIVVRINPGTLYMNDGAPLARLFGNAKFKKTTRVKPYCGSLVDQLAHVLREPGVGAGADGEYATDANSKISYRDALGLDPSITYPEYCLIYGPNTYV